MAQCPHHPDRPATARGLCHTCYHREIWRKGRAKRMHHNYVVPRAADPIVHLLAERISSSDVPLQMVARKSGVSVYKLYHWLQGHSDPALADARAVLEIFNLSISVRPKL